MMELTHKMVEINSVLVLLHGDAALIVINES